MFKSIATILLIAAVSAQEKPAEKKPEDFDYSGTKATDGSWVGEKKELELCTSGNDCGDGLACTPITKEGVDYKYCLAQKECDTQAGAQVKQSDGKTSVGTKTAGVCLYREYSQKEGETCTKSSDCEWKIDGTGKSCAEMSAVSFISLEGKKTCNPSSMCGT